MTNTYDTPNGPSGTRPDELAGSTHSAYGGETGDSSKLQDQLKHDAQQTKDKLQQEAKTAAEDVKGQAKERAQEGVAKASAEIDKLSSVIDSAADALSEQDREGLASYAHELSAKVSRFAGHLQDRSVEELAGEARDLARNNPTAFLLGSVAIGFGLSRFFKASAHHNPTATGATTTDYNDGLSADRAAAHTPISGAPTAPARNYTPGSIS